MHHIKDKDVYIGTAAVSDYSPIKPHDSKIKKDGSHSSMVLELKENRDILHSVSELKKRPYVVGFAAETDDLIDNAKKKLNNKSLDLIVANDVSDKNIGFDSDDNEVTLITHKEQKLLAKQNKKKISSKIIEFISGRINDETN
jgi:phosphopantothenoylcysteine decarboxylase/phosphopantothenate--cysteine ligase